MAQQLLDLAQIGPHIEQMGRVAVAQPMRVDVVGDARAASPGAQDAAHVARAQAARPLGPRPQRP